MLGIFVGSTVIVVMEGAGSGERDWLSESGDKDRHSVSRWHCLLRQARDAAVSWSALPRASSSSAALAFTASTNGIHSSM